MTPRTTIKINRSSLPSHEIERIARIYRQCFPGSIRSLLGQSACVRFFTAVLNSEDSISLTARHGNTIVGFALLIESNQRLNLSQFLLKTVPDIFRLNIRTNTKLLKKIIKKFLKKMAVKSQNSPKICCIEKDSKNEAMIYLDILAVEKSFRRLGIGKALVENCLQIARQNGFVKLELTVKMDNEKAIKLYESVGFGCLIKDTETRYCTLCINA